MRRCQTLAAVMIALTSMGATTHAAEVTAFTYQGQLKDAGRPVEGTADVRYRLYDAASGGGQIGPQVTTNGITVAGGVFHNSIDFGPNAYSGSQSRWLEIDIRSPAGSGNFITLGPRQPLTPTPFALRTRGLEVTSSGNVGIGTVNPLEKLDVEGAARVTGFQLDTLDAAPGKVLMSDAFGIATWQTVPCAPLPCISTGSVNGCAFSVTNNGTGNAVCGHAGAATGNYYGISGTSSSATGTGVYGSAVNGVQGISTTANGRGVFGYASGGADAWAVSGQTATGQAVVGLAGTSLPTSGFPGGTGVVGYSNVPGAFGMWAQVTDANAVGLTASNISNTGPGIGLRSYSQSTAGTGLAGIQVAPTGNTFGAYGEAASVSGTGVYGNAIATSGSATGVWGATASPTGTGVLGSNNSATGAAVGVHGYSISDTGSAVVGTATAPTGASKGVYGESFSTSGTGVYGLATAASGSTYGVYGRSDSSVGVGVYGFSPASTGTIGVSTGTGGIGVYGGADSATGTTYAIYGSTVSTSGWAGFFLGGKGVYVANNIGVGTQTPSEKLEVVGNIKTSGSVFASCGTLSCSDRRFKKDIAQFDGALGMVEKLHPVRFEWKRDEFPDRQFSDQRQIGLIAQELADVAPEFVQRDGSGYLAVDYGRLTPVLVGAVQEQQKTIAAQEQEISALRARLERIEALATRLERGASDAK